jgi:4-hydroxy-2-oxoheptanedioate aldolase
VTTNRLRERCQGGQRALGGWCVTGSPLAAELLAVEGYDYVCVDCQHGLIGYEGMVAVLQALARTGTTPVARVPWNQPGDIGKALDAGAEAVIVPMVNSAEEAGRAAAACRYPPDGLRSFGPVRSNLFLGADPVAVNREVLCLVMIETVGAVERADAICQVPGVDGVYIGPSDLAVSMGLSPSASASSKQHVDAIETVRLACQRAGIIAGIHTTGGLAARRYLEQGFQMTTLGTDAAILRAAAAAHLAAAKG